MTRENLIDKIAQSMCDSVDQKTLLQLYYDDRILVRLTFNRRASRPSIIHSWRKGGAR